MRDITMKTVLRAALCAGLTSFQLFAADPSADSGAGNFWELVLGLMLTVFGGMAFCYGLVRLGEKFVQTVRARHLVSVPVPRIRHAA
jgi:hypothetical protein